MGKIVLMLWLTCASVSSLVKPWIGVVCAYFIIILTPQQIWWWNFEEVRPVYWILLATLPGFALKLFQSQYDLYILRNRRNVFLFILWCCFTVSYLAGPYVDVAGPFRFRDPSLLFSLVNKIFVLYFMGCVCINSERSLAYLVWALIISLMYLIYWCNAEYLSGMQSGRITGPGGAYAEGTYGDENAFAMLFVTGLPFLFYVGLYCTQVYVRWALWLSIPFGWHAIFLTGSRGGLVGLGMTLIIAAVRSPRKMLGISMIPLFIGAYVWQAGDIMRSRAATIGDYRTETSAATRFEAWAAAINMISSYPLTGVGLASFGPAFPDHSDKAPREAHNTFLQITAESGLIAGAMYVLIVSSSLIGLWKNGKHYKQADHPHKRLLYFLNEATLTSLCGLVTCSLFLSLQIFEIFYYLCLLVNSVLYLGKTGLLQSRNILLERKHENSMERARRAP